MIFVVLSHVTWSDYFSRIMCPFANTYSVMKNSEKAASYRFMNLESCLSMKKKNEDVECLLGQMK